MSSQNNSQTFWGLSPDSEESCPPASSTLLSSSLLGKSPAQPATFPSPADAVQARPFTTTFSNTNRIISADDVSAAGSRKSSRAPVNARSSSTHQRRGRYEQPHASSTHPTAAFAKMPASGPGGVVLLSWEAAAVQLCRQMARRTAGNEPPRCADEMLLFRLCGDPAPVAMGGANSASPPAMLLQFFLQTRVLAQPTSAGRSSKDPPPFSDVEAAARTTAAWFTSHLYYGAWAEAPGRDFTSCLSPRRPTLSPLLLPRVAVPLAEAGRITARNAAVWLYTVYASLLYPEEGSGTTLHGTALEPDCPAWPSSHAVADAVFALQQLGHDDANPHATRRGWRLFSIRFFIHILGLIVGTLCAVETDEESGGDTLAGDMTEPLLALAFVMKRHPLWGLSPTPASEDTANGASDPDLDSVREECLLRWNAFILKASSRVSALHKKPIRTTILLDYLLT